MTSRPHFSLIELTNRKRMNDGFPIFEGAKSQMESFLIDQNWPIEIVWCKETDIKRTQPGKAQIVSNSTYGEGQAKFDYEGAVDRGLGVAILGLGATQKEAYVAIAWPKDEDESERLMYSAADLKLGVISPRPSLKKTMS